MKRPIWLLSMDSDQFHAAPTTTATLKAYYLQHGNRQDEQTIELVHFRDSDEVLDWQQKWHHEIIQVAKKALDKNLQPIIGLSFYTWNAAEFLSLVADLKNTLPQLLIIAGGPHVQQAEDYLGHDPIDLIFLGEGERTFTEVLDATSNDFSDIDGLAYLDHMHQVVKTGERERIKDLAEIPSPLNVLELCDDNGSPLYESISYETSRGCPFKCAFCEWGTGAIGTRMNQFPLSRLYEDWETIVKAGIENIWLADSNFGALKEDLEKTQLICDLKNRYGLPYTFATSWSKKHSSRVQEMVLLLNKNGLLPHYQLALQTLTPLALELSNRKNMDANKYEPIAKEMAQAGVPIAAELIWGLPGDNLSDFEANLDTLLATFPNINIFGYTLLPGTEFYDRRDEYQIKAIPVAGYGKAKGEYVIGCHTFDEEEGIEGYFLITAHILLIHGHLLPLTIRYLALEGSTTISPLLRKILYALLDLVEQSLAGINLNDKMLAYENRDKIYLALFENLDTTYSIIKTAIKTWLIETGADSRLITKTLQHLQLDRIFTPLPGQRSLANYHFDFNAIEITEKLEAMEIPDNKAYQTGSSITVQTPGGLGEILLDPDGGSWHRGCIIKQHESLAHEVE